MTKVSIALIHFGKIDVTNECLASLFKLDHKNIELSIIIINNDQSLEFPEVKSQNGIKVKVVNSRENSGFSGGHNRGFRYALKNDSDYHMVLNNDVTVDKKLVVELVKSMENDITIGIASPKIYFSKGSEFHKDRYKKEDLGKVIWYAGGITDWRNLINKHRGVDDVDKGQFDKVIDTDFATGACFIIPTDVIRKIGKFDDRYFLYYEDGDLNMRIKKAGYRSVFVPSAYLWHRNAASSGSGSPLQDYYITRNRMLFGFSYAPFRTKLALLKESLRIFRNGREWQKKGIRDFYARRFGKGSFPIR